MPPMYISSSYWLWIFLVGPRGFLKTVTQLLVLEAAMTLWVFFPCFLALPPPLHHFALRCPAASCAVLAAADIA